MTNEKIFCSSCGSAINESSVFCKKCGRSVHLYEKNIIQRLNDRINILSIILGLLISAIFLVLCSLFYSLFLYNQIIDFIIYMGLTIITAIFFGGLAIGILGCSDYYDAKSNSITFVLIIINIFAIIFGFGFSTAIGLATVLSGVFGGSNSEPTSSSMELESTSSDLSYSVTFILEILMIGILAIVAGIGGCYLGVFLKKFVADE